MKLVVLKCPYCGGRLESRDDHFICLHCDNMVVKATDQYDDAPSHNGFVNAGKNDYVLHIMHESIQSEYPFSNSIEIIFNYRRRATMADPLPMNMSVATGNRKILVLEELPNVGKGSIQIECDGKCIMLYNDSQIQAFINGKDCGIMKSISVGDVLTVGGVEIGIIPRTNKPRTELCQQK